MSLSEKQLIENLNQLFPKPEKTEQEKDFDSLFIPPSRFYVSGEEISDIDDEEAQKEFLSIQQEMERLNKLVKDEEKRAFGERKKSYDEKREKEKRKSYRDITEGRFYESYGWFDDGVFNVDKLDEAIDDEKAHLDYLKDEAEEAKDKSNKTPQTSKNYFVRKIQKEKAYLQYNIQIDRIKILNKLKKDIMEVEKSKTKRKQDEIQFKNSLKEMEEFDKEIKNDMKEDLKNTFARLTKDKIEIENLQKEKNKEKDKSKKNILKEIIDKKVEIYKNELKEYKEQLAEYKSMK